MNYWRKLLIVLFFGMLLIPIVTICIQNFNTTQVTTDDIELAGLTSSSWDANGTAVCTQTGDQTYPVICCDDVGNAFIAWQDYRSSGDPDIYAQKINADGVLQWTAGGIPVCTETDDQDYVQICLDGTGGVILVWEDRRTGSDDIYAQRLDKDGNALWTAGGIPICNAELYQKNPKILSDGAGSFFIIWEDFRIGIYYNLYGQKVDLSGAPQWDANGSVICNAYGEQSTISMCSDGGDGLIAAWQDWRTAVHADIFAQRFNASGDYQWDSNGTIVCNYTGSQYAPEICSDGSGGAIIVWQDFRNGISMQVYAQKVNAMGITQWIDNGTNICLDASHKSFAKLCSDGAGGAHVVWEEYRNGLYDIYMQRVDTNGNLLSGVNGTAVCNAPNDQRYPEICHDSAGNYVIVWCDMRVEPEGDLYAQKYNAAGIAQFEINGTVICSGNSYQNDHQICCDSSGRTFVVWGDLRAALVSDIYAACIGCGDKGIPGFQILPLLLCLFAIVVIFQRNKTF